MLWVSGGEGHLKAAPASLYSDGSVISGIYMRVSSQTWMKKTQYKNANSGKYGFGVFRLTFLLSSKSVSLGV